MTPEEIAAAEARAKKANEHVIELARRGGKNWTMRVPVDLEHDSDCVLIAPTRDVPRLIATIRGEQQRAEAAEANGEQYRQNWLSLQRVIGEECHLRALERVRALKAAEAEARGLREALERIRQGYSNLLEFRKIAGIDRYGALTREEIEQERALIDAALATPAQPEDSTK